MAEFDRIKRNITKMMDQSAPEADIDAYLESEGVSAGLLSPPPHFVRHSQNNTTAPAPNANQVFVFMVFHP